MEISTVLLFSKPWLQSCSRNQECLAQGYTTSSVTQHFCSSNVPLQRAEIFILKGQLSSGPQLTRHHFPLSQTAPTWGCSGQHCCPSDQPEYFPVSSHHSRMKNNLFSREQNSSTVTTRGTAKQLSTSQLKRQPSSVHQPLDSETSSAKGGQFRKGSSWLCTKYSPGRRDRSTFVATGCLDILKQITSWIPSGTEKK